MNIILHVNSYIPIIGGREIVVHYLAREFLHMGHNVRVLGPSGWLKHRNLRFEYPVHRWPTLRGLFPEQVTLAQLQMDVALWGCDIIHAHSTFPSGYAVSQLKKKRSIPLVITPHGEDIHVVPEIGFGHRLDPVKRHKIDIAIEKAEILTAISKGVEHSLHEAGCPTAKIRAIPNGIDPERFQRKSLPDIRKWLGIEKNAPVILSVGNYHPRKGHEVLLRAMPLILKMIPEAQLIIAGRNPQALKPLVASLAIADHVHLTGALAFPTTLLNHGIAPETAGHDDQLAALYADSDLYVSASIDEGAEGLSLALLDAMAAGLPVVATTISGNIDIVKNQKSGLLVPPSDPQSLADAVVRILTDPELKSRMGTEGHRLIQPFHWRNIAQSYLEVYEEAIRQCRSGLKPDQR